METVTQQDVEQAIFKASREVFETMLNLPLEIEPSVMTKVIEPETFHGVVALVGVAGSWTGAGHISCSPQFAQKLAGALLMTEYNSVNEDVLDAVAEVANMIVGNVKTIFEEKLGPLGLTVPTVIYGRNYHTRSAGVKDWVLVRLRSNSDSMDINFCLMPSRAPFHYAPRTEMLTA
ncbi:MAG TPA: chemotaxis protein CheX [Bryobacteraceae bacterium]|jgi:chemotaxis protein CheX|nr:chemotaxis protein CheX [Bryobacteraceae bacterium]